MTDNFKNYEKLIHLNGGLPADNEKGTLDKYYVIELMRRGKDNPDLPAANYHFKNYYIYSWRDLERYKEEIKNICELLRLRAYCSVNYKLMSQVAVDTVYETARRIALHDYKRFDVIFERCSAKYVDQQNKLWIIDIDGDVTEDYLYDMQTYINGMASKYDNKIVFVMPTRNGVHLICRPFNANQFKDGFKAFFGNHADEIPEIKKNHLTLLYENL